MRPHCLQHLPQPVRRGVKSRSSHREDRKVQDEAVRKTLESAIGQLTIDKS